MSGYEGSSGDALMETLGGSGSESGPESESPRQVSIPTVRPEKGGLRPDAPRTPSPAPQTRPREYDGFQFSSRFGRLRVPQGRMYPVSRWILLIAFVLASVYTVGRMIWSQTHTRLPNSFGLGLDSAHHAKIFNLDDGYRLVEVDGIPVGNPGTLSEVLDSSSAKETRLRFERQDRSRRIAREVVWVVSPELPEIDGPIHDSYLLGPGVDPGRYGMAGGERIVSVGGPWPGGPGWQRLFDVPDTGILRLTVQPAGRDLPPHDVIICHIDWSAQWTRFSVGSFLGFLGVFVFWRLPETRSSHGFTALTLMMGLSIFSGAVPHPYRLELENVARLLLHVLLPSAALLFVLRFSAWRLAVAKARFPMLLTWSLGACAIVANRRFFPDEADAGSLGSPIVRAMIGVYAALVLCALCGEPLARAFRARLRATDRQRGITMRFVACVALLLALVYAALSYWDVGRDIRIFLEFAVMACPAMLAYAVLRHGALEFRELIRDAAPYLALLVALPAAYAALVDGLLPLAGLWAGLEFGLASPVVMAALGLAAVLIRPRIRDHFQFRIQGVPANYDSLLQSFSEKAAIERMPQAFCDMAARELARTSHAPNVVIITRYPGDDSWNIAAATPGPRLERALECMDALVSLLQLSRREIRRDDLLEDVRYGEVRLRALAAMDELSASVVLPMMIHDRMVGVVAFGDKAGFRNFSTDDLRSLRRVTRHMAFTLWGMVDTLLARRNTRIVDLHPALPDVIGRWSISGFLGKGGMSYVYLGRHEGTEAAVKVANGAVQASVLLLERFHREALSMKRIDHPNIVHVLEVAHAKGEPYIALEYFSGGSLRDMVRTRGPLGEPEVLDYARQAVHGLNAALRHGVIHRDIKPRNLFLSSGGVLKVGDFGLARMEDISTITSVGDVLGTPDYMSPEVARGDRVDWRADQYALGITMYELLAGKRPFKSDRADALILQYLTGSVPDIRKQRPEVSVLTARIIIRMISKVPEKRFPSYDELIEALSHALEWNRGGGQVDGSEGIH